MYQHPSIQQQYVQRNLDDERRVASRRLSDSSVKLILLLVVEVEKFTKESELNSLFHGGLEPPYPSLTKGSPRHGYCWRYNKEGLPRKSIGR
jgi:hypothetical protein